ncbi:hypothetical protein C3D80_11565 [Cronobacter sakazakii]|nr:hypothetical protein CsakCS09_00345 [Cronobacter sakazakii]EGT4322555.1 hypothetical protein [Cronobacter sakazakii]EGT5664599.1 hypothetical protein [Cronobacter sakazakii]EGZ6860048.1 hypothetical protein [Cronobacter sakazakii]EGZ6869431.1 hypothetical protein [Cronobacter sakazakii]
MDRGTHNLVARFAFYVGDQAETTVISLKRFIVQHISEPPQALRDSLLNRWRAGAKRVWRQGMALNAHLACRPPDILFHRYIVVEDLLKRESHLLHKYDGQNAHRESFQRISNLSGIRTQVKCHSYLFKSVLKSKHSIDK